MNECESDAAQKNSLANIKELSRFQPIYLGRRYFFMINYYQ